MDTEPYNRKKAIINHAYRKADMPKEDRLITFSNDEIHKAIFSLCMQKGMARPPEGVVTKTFHPDGDKDRITVEITDPRNNKVESVDYNYDFFAAALMLFCRGLGIPLPKSAKKSVHIKDDEVSLRVRIG
jgi:hypothetical protein